MQVESKPFNRETEDSFSKSGKIFFDTVNRRTRIDNNATAMMNARKGMYIHFVPFEDLCYVAVNDDPTGYKLGTSAARAGLSFNNMKFIRWFFAKNKIHVKAVHFLLLPADNLEWHGAPLFAITKKTNRLIHHDPTILSFLKINCDDLL
jgi:hypothetical protein